MIRRYCEDVPKEAIKKEETKKADLVKKKKNNNKKTRRKNKKTTDIVIEVSEPKPAQVYDTQLDEIVCGTEPP